MQRTPLPKFYIFPTLRARLICHTHCHVACSLRRSSRGYNLNMHSPDQSSAEPGIKGKRLSLLPVLIFVVCTLYFGWRYWESREHIYGLLAGINAFGLLMALGFLRR